MTAVTIGHRTTYRYRCAVVLSPHRLMLRPRPGHDLKLLLHMVEISPDATSTSRPRTPPSEQTNRFGGLLSCRSSDRNYLLMCKRHR